MKLACLLLFATSLFAQTASVPPTAAESLAKLTPEEKTRFDAAGKDFNAQKFAESLVVYKALLAAHPGDPLLSKMTGEAATDTGDTKLALTVLQPIETQNPDDWQAAALLSRIYAETGDKTHRDAEFAHMTELYKKGVTPKGLTQYIVEKVNVGDRRLIIWNSFEPWGNFKVYNYARVFDKDGKLVQRITLESSDMDQTFWAKQHPKEAAAGGRMFSLDGYSEGRAGREWSTHRDTRDLRLPGREAYLRRGQGALRGNRWRQRWPDEQQHARRAAVDLPGAREVRPGF